jgi:hypothetical protein
MRIALLCLAVATLTSCAAVSPTASRAPKDKQVDVDVGPEWGVFGGKPVIKLNEETGVRGGTQQLVWSLRAAATDGGYRFGRDGITFEYPAPKPPPSCTSTPDPALAFEACGPDSRELLFSCRRKGRPVAGACYKYTVRLQSTEGSEPVEPKDPWIMDE